MSTKKTKFAGALAIVLTIGALCAGGGLFATNNVKINSDFNCKAGNSKCGKSKNKQHKEVNCKDSNNEKKDCSQDRCN